MYFQISIPTLLFFLRHHYTQKTKNMNNKLQLWWRVHSAFIILSVRHLNSLRALVVM